MFILNIKSQQKQDNISENNIFKNKLHLRKKQDFIKKNFRDSIFEETFEIIEKVRQTILFGTVQNISAWPPFGAISCFSRLESFIPQSLAFVLINSCFLSGLLKCHCVFSNVVVCSEI